jgi:hypothetical protein
MKGTFSIHHPTCPAFACAGQLEKIMYRDSAERWRYIPSRVFSFTEISLAPLKYKAQRTTFIRP